VDEATSRRAPGGMALRDWQTGWQWSLGWKTASSREFAANPIGVFFDPDSACDAQKAAANESLRVSVKFGNARRNLSPGIHGAAPREARCPPQ
jgi:hypothetical protein